MIFLNIQLSLFKWQCCLCKQRAGRILYDPGKKLGLFHE